RNHRRRRLLQKRLLLRLRLRLRLRLPRRLPPPRLRVEGQRQLHDLVP
ncbi:hypothetical protein CLIM01_13782, partial [Colletotrichum limetticola]